MATLTEAVSSNDRRATLLALRDSIARAIDGTDSGRDIAALSKRLMEVMEEIDSLPDPKEKGSPLERERKRVAERTADG